MIFVERDRHQDALAALDKRGRNGLTESEHARWHFGGEPPVLAPLPAKPGKAPTFTAYKRQPVKEALGQLFGPKCAYCEFPYAGGAPMEVEHYRPKGGYLDERGTLRKPGYYWLAADWDNLLPSCVDCNRERKQVYRSRDGKLLKGKSGKANHFPILAGTARATAPAGIGTEQPLLLDPCRDRPEDHLRFLADGFVEPAITAQEAERPKGKATIEVYGLTREGLVGNRRERALPIKAAMQSVFVADANLRHDPSNPIALPMVAAAEAALAAFDTPQAPFRAMLQSMQAAFVAVRGAAVSYHAAHSAWQDSPGNATRSAHVASIAAIKRLRVDALLDRLFVAELLALAGVPTEAPASVSGTG